MHETALKILLVEDNPGDARLIEESITEDVGDAIRLEWVQDLSAALAVVSSELFDAVLLDLNLPDSNGFETFVKMRSGAADIPVLVLTGLEDSQIGLKAIQQGAQDYLVKSELTGSMVARALRFAVERHRNRLRESRQQRPSPPGKVIGFMGVKGGVGTTTVTLNIAALIAKNTRHLVTAVELTPVLGSFSAHLHESPAHNIGTLARIDPETISNSVIEKCLSHCGLGFEALYSPQRPPDFFEPKADVLGNLVERLARRTDIVLLDVPGPYTPSAEAALATCDLVALVTERDPSSLAAAQVLLRWLARREALPSIGLIVVNRTLIIDGASPKQIETDLGCDVLGVVPPAPEIAAGAQKSGSPIALHRPLSAPANMLNGIAEKITRLTGKPIARAARRPVLQAITA